MSSTISGLLTFEEFERLPDPPDGGRYELLEGELSLMPPPKKGHKEIQMTLERWFLRKLPENWECASEFGVCIGKDSYLVPDVVVTERTRWESTPRDGYFKDSPELVVEVISPSNTARAITTKIALYFEHGAQQCWIIDPRYERITVHSIDEGTRIYSGTASLSVTRFGIDEPLPLSLIFSS